MDENFDVPDHARPEEEEEEESPSTPPRAGPLPPPVEGWPWPAPVFIDHADNEDVIRLQRHRGHVLGRC